MTHKPLSNCCESPIRIGGGKGLTHYQVCCKCNRPCDILSNDNRMIDKNDERLLPCPFCGANAILNKVGGYSDDSFTWFIKCFNCGMGDRIVSSKKRAIKRWETRNHSITYEKWLEIMMPFHGGNPKSWEMAMDRVWDEHIYKSKIDLPKNITKEELCKTLDEADKLCKDKFNGKFIRNCQVSLIIALLESKKENK